MLDNKKKKILNELFYGGQTTKTTTICGDISVTFKNLTVGDQLRIEDTMQSIEGVPVYTLHTFALKTVAATLVKYGKHDFSTSTFEEIEAFLKTLPGTILDALVEAQNTFEQEIKELLTGDVIDENFSKTGSTEDDLTAS